MPRIPGHDKDAVESRNAEQTKEFNIRFLAFEVELQALLLEQEIGTRDRPSDRLINAKEIADRMKKYFSEIIDPE